MQNLLVFESLILSYFSKLNFTGGFTYLISIFFLFELNNIKNISLGGFALSGSISHGPSMKRKSSSAMSLELVHPFTPSTMI